LQAGQAFFDYTNLEVEMPVILWLLGVPLSVVLVLLLVGAI